MNLLNNMSGCQNPCRRYQRSSASDESGLRGAGQVGI